MVVYGGMGVNELDTVVVYRERETTIMAANALRMCNKVLSNAAAYSFGLQRDYLAAARPYEATEHLLIERLDLSPPDFSDSKVLSGNFTQRRCGIKLRVESLNRTS
jgi:hypothetical protein